MKYMHSHEPFGSGGGEDPMASVGNLFDIALVFVVALLFALMTRGGAEILQGKTEARVSKTGEIEIITREGKTLKHLKQSQEKAEGRGVRLGTAYRLEDGTTIYVPEE